MKTGIVDVGGGLRGIYTTGLLDYCMDHNIRFDLAIGVSAGSANLASFGSGQRGRNYRFLTEYAFRKEYMSLGHFLRTRSFVNLDYVYSTLSNSDGENPYDYAALRDNPMEFLVVATDARTGLPRYFDKGDIRQDDYDVMKASCSLPAICRPYVIDGVPYYDGALGDPVPVEKAFSLGCDRVVLMLTKPEGVRRDSKRDEKFAARIRREFPAAAEQLCLRARHYNDSVDRARAYARQGKLLIVAPDDTCGIKTLTRDQDGLRRLYEKGYGDGPKIAAFMSAEDDAPASRHS